MKSNTVTASSNWKKLLPTIKSSSPKQTSNKRKSTDADNKSHTKKKIKVEESVKTAIPSKDDLWFGDDIDEKDLQLAYSSAKELKKEERDRKKQLVKKMNEVKGKDAKLGKYVAIDCEMVGVGPTAEESALARVSLVNFNGAVLLDTFVKPQERVTDYRTKISGVHAKDLINAPSFKEVQQQVADIIKDRILVGHAVHNDLQALMLDHPKLLIRDTQRYKEFRKLSRGRTPGLKMLVQKVLEVDIQSGSHSSVEDARFTMLLYRKVKDNWEKSFGARSGLQMKKLAIKEKKRKYKIVSEKEDEHTS
ncbi:3'-5' exonuclease [Apophysomyces ossiformis]|uniref:RNA exonuclease 4 n=1 Tax=Apophysomyces ossiformis TaxID=679940 RepID=A0A8H7EMJ2_9FUNG|nr:3'-5' exonuclease [Apophysomyces ossiformis]